MSRAKAKKYYYYIVVFTSTGPRYVTGIGEHNTAYWELDKEPMQFSKEYGRNIVLGLVLNFWNAGLVELPIDINCHPYNYKDYTIKFEKKENTNDDEKE